MVSRFQAQDSFRNQTGDRSVKKQDQQEIIIRLMRYLRNLVNHDMAADIREGLPHCYELEMAIMLLDELDENCNEL